MTGWDVFWLLAITVVWNIALDKVRQAWRYRHPRQPAQNLLAKMARDFEERTGIPAEPIPGGYRMKEADGSVTEIQAY